MKEAEAGAGSQRAWVVGVALTLTLARFLPLAPAVPSGGLDGGYQFALHVAHAQGLQFGPDLIYTYGPLGFLEFRQFHPETFGWVVAWWTLLAVTLTWSALRAVRVLGLQPRAAAGWLAVWLWTADPFFALLLLVWFLALEDPKRPAPLRALHVIALAVLALGKQTHLLGAAPLLTLLAARDARARRAPWELLGFVAALLALWPVAGQSLASLPAYLVGAQEVIAGHAEAMVVKGRSAHLERIGFFVPALLLGLFAARRRGGRRLLWLGGALILFLAFKSGFVRHDGHVLTATRTLFLAALLFLPWASLRGRNDRVAAALLLSAALLTHTAALRRHGVDPLHELQPRAAWATLRGGRAGLAQRRAAAVERIRVEANLPPLEGTVDVFGNDLAIALALPNRWQPRPVIQSFLAYTPRLARLNAAHLRGGSAADTIVFEPGPIDRRYPSLDDGRAWPALLSRYAVDGVTDRFCLLKRRAEPTPALLEPISTAEVRFGAWHPVPPLSAAGPVWVALDLPTDRALVRLTTLVHRTPRIFLEVRLASGEEVRYRLVPGSARAGFVLSPRVEDALGFAELASTGWRSALARQAITAFRVRTSWILGADYRVRLARLRFEHQDLRRLDLSSRRYPNFTTPPTSVRGVSSVYVLPGGRRVFHSHPPGAVTLPAGAGPILKLGFGILDRAWAPGRSDGVTFSAIALVGDRRRTIWTRHLDPRNHAADRGEQHVAVPVPANARVTLEVSPGRAGNPAYDWAYWSRVAW